MSKKKDSGGESGGTNLFPTTPALSKGDMYVCSCVESKIAFISPTHKELHQQIVSTFPPSEARSIFRGLSNWRISRARDRFKSR